MKVLAIIPARGGSKGIRRKNIKKFAGRPLLVYTIDQAKASRHINRVVVSTEDKEIASVARRTGAEVPVMRPVELAQDHSKGADAVLHMLDYLKKTEGYVPDIIVALQVTSPLRLVEDIDGALELMRKRSADSVVSVCGTEQLLYTKDKKDELHLVSNEEFMRSTNRQELEATYKLDGSMVYAVKTKVFLATESFLAGKLVGYVIPRWRAVDIDEPQDFVVGELLFKNCKEISRKLKNFK